jgi:flagellar biosynthesis protein FlhF
MIVKSYTGRTMAEALEKVRNDLGSEALIIETRTVREPGLLGRKAGYEVVAAREEVDAAPAREPQIRPWQAEELPRHQAARLTPAPAPVEPPASHLEEELASIRRQLARLAAGQGTPTGHLGEDLARALEDAELPADVVAELDSAVAKAGARLDDDRKAEFCALLLERGLTNIAPLDWSGCRRLMLVGATGVGKTTTIAKLAGDLVLRQKRKVALITIDTYRVGATDQLTAYADLLSIPMEVASTPAQLGRLLEQFSAYDHVLIDTAGRSPADAARVHELKGFTRAAPGISVMLAAAATTGRAEFAAVVERFSILPLEHVVVTKLDECVAPGRLYGCLRRHRLPVRFVTTGQEVPDDIETATAAIFARRAVPQIA